VGEETGRLSFSRYSTHEPPLPPPVIAKELIYIAGEGRGEGKKHKINTKRKH
jgi:hypothetical protein